VGAHFSFFNILMEGSAPAGKLGNPPSGRLTISGMGRNSEVVIASTLGACSVGWQMEAM
jgi:hypothetical protein